MRSTLIQSAIAGLLLAALAACSTPSTTRPDAAAPPVTKATGSQVEQRALARWELLIAGKTADAYNYLSPGYRELKSQEVYAADMLNRPVKWTKAELVGSECPKGAEYCDVTVNIYYELQSTLPGVGELKSYSPVSERWISSQGSWYFVPKEVARK